VKSAPRIRLRFTLNGRAVELETEPLRRLLDLLRDDLRLAGTKEGCGEGECGACTVLVDGVAVNSCLEACEVTTIEGAGFDELQRAFLDHGGAQCGICTPGAIVMARAWLDECAREHAAPDLEGARRALAGNLCRCTGYSKILASVLAAARREP
jgi:carbon-monoxide dehydrogenase small subunit